MFTEAQITLIVSQLAPILSERIKVQPLNEYVEADKYAAETGISKSMVLVLYDLGKLLGVRKDRTMLIYRDQAKAKADLAQAELLKAQKELVDLQIKKAEAELKRLKVA